MTTDDLRSLNVKDDRGEVHFLLQRIEGGLYVQCERMPRRGLRSMQAIRFIDAADFHPATPAEIAREAEAAGVWATMEPYVMALTSDA